MACIQVRHEKAGSSSAFIDRKDDSDARLARGLLVGNCENAEVTPVRFAAKRIQAVDSLAGLVQKAVADQVDRRCAA